MNSSNSNNLLQYSVEPISLEISKKINKQMKHCLCKIKNDDKIGTGFLCKINQDENTNFKVLITNYDMIKENDLINNKTIKIYLNQDEDYRQIQLNNNAKIYFNQYSNISILIIENNDNLNNDKNYLELDDDLFNYNNNFSFNKKSIYILQYQNQNTPCVSFGKIKEVNESKIFHLCKVENNSKGVPILNLSNNKVIGIQNENNINGFNIGIFLKNAINDVINMKKNNSFNFGMNNNFNNFAQNFYNNNINNLNNQFNNMNINMNLNMNPNMNFGMFNPNNFGFNMMNNNLNNNMFMLNNNFNNNMMFNQMNMMNNNNNNAMQMKSVKEQKININDRYIGELRKGPGNKINCCFTKINGEKTSVIVNYGTTIHQLLTNYLKIQGMHYLDQRYISFIKYGDNLNLSNFRAIEDICKTTDYFITVNLSDSPLFKYKKFFFETTSGITLTLYFEIKETVEKLLKSFFNEVKKPELFGKDDKINFLYNAKKIKYKNKEIIGNTFKEYDCRIIVIDTSNLLI